MRDMKISYTESLQLWHLLAKCPKKIRTSYGKREFKSQAERKLITRVRNRLHAQHTRLRKRIFSEVLKLRDSYKKNKTITSDEMQGLPADVEIDDYFFDIFDN
jgi:hypothetical protein